MDRQTTEADIEINYSVPTGTEAISAIDADIEPQDVADVAPAPDHAAAVTNGETESGVTPPEAKLLWTGEKATGETRHLIWAALGLTRPAGFKIRHFPYLTLLETPKTRDEIHAAIKAKSAPAIEANLMRLMKIGLIERLSNPQRWDNPIYRRVEISFSQKLSLLSPFPLMKSAATVYDYLTEPRSLRDVAKHFGISTSNASSRLNHLVTLGVAKSRSARMSENGQSYLQSHLEFPEIKNPGEADVVSVQKRHRFGNIVEILVRPRPAGEIADALDVTYDAARIRLKTLVNSGLVKSFLHDDRVRYYYRACDVFDPANIVVTPKPGFEPSALQISLLQRMPATGHVVSDEFYRGFEATNYRDRQPLYIAMNALDRNGLVEREIIDNVRLISLTDLGRNHPGYKSRPAAGAETALKQALPTNRLRLLAAIDMLGSATSSDVKLAIGDRVLSKDGKEKHIAPCMSELTEQGLIKRDHVERHARSRFSLTVAGQELINRYPNRASLPTIEEMRQRIAHGMAERHLKYQNAIARNFTRPGEVMKLLRTHGTLNTEEILANMPDAFSDLRAVAGAMKHLAGTGRVKKVSNFDPKTGAHASWALA